MTNEELIYLATSITHPISLSYDNSAGTVGCALLADNDKTYIGVCIDTSSGMGFCAEHNAMGSMITDQITRIKKIVSIKKFDNGDIKIMYPCGRCREFMRQIDEKNMDTDVITKPKESKKLFDLLPYN